MRKKKKMNKQMFKDYFQQMIYMKPIKVKMVGDVNLVNDALIDLKNNVIEKGIPESQNPD